MNQSQIVREELLDAQLTPTAAVDRVKLARVVLAPGQATGLHRHPCNVVGSILDGEVRFQVEGEPERTLHPGDAFHEPAGRRIAHFDNASGDHEVVFLACYALAPGEDRLIEVLDG